jgi:putative membrane protein insertion efficiency factor
VAIVTWTTTVFHRVAATALKLPIKLYRYTLSPLIGQHCRHMPSCSQYGLDAIETNGAWRGFWLTLSRVALPPLGHERLRPCPRYSRRNASAVGGLALWALAPEPA